MNARRQASWRLLGAAVAAVLAFTFSATNLTAPADTWLQQLLGPERGTPYVCGWAWLAALVAASLWWIRPRTGRHGRPAGWLWACAPACVAAVLYWAADIWWPPLATTLAILLVAVLRRWRRRRFPELEHITGLQSAADSALRASVALPYSLIRLQLRGPGMQALPLQDLVPALKAHARRSGDRVARSGADGFVLWLAHTDAEAALALACEIRADLAALLARHDLRCSMGIATAAEPGIGLEQLWHLATPPTSEA